MTRILMVADDLTGGNGCAAGFTRAGLRAATLRADASAAEIGTHLDAYDALVVTTDSRHLPAARATAAVTAVLDAGWPADLVCSRADSTLRGNFGAEAEAVITGVRARGRRAVGLCMPAFPTADRQTVHGLQLLGGTRLEHTELAHDVRSPMTSSSVAEALRKGTHLSTLGIDLAAVTGPRSALVDRIRTLLSEDPDVIIADALTEDHLRDVAEAAVEADPEVMWVGIDPGPGSLAIARAMGAQGAAGAPPLLAIAGSATELTQAQLQRVLGERPTTLVRPVPRAEDSAVPDVEATAAEVSAAVRRARAGEIVLLASVVHPEDVRELSDEESDALPEALGRIAARVIAAADGPGTGAADTAVIGGLYTTGGDITTSVLAALGAVGMEIDEEVVPLAAAGALVGGPWAGLPIVTKGGLVGDAGTALACLDHLSGMVRMRTRLLQSRAAQTTARRPAPDSPARKDTP